MQVPVQTVFRDMPVSDAVEAVCWAQAEKLERFHGRITSCRVVITAADCRRGRNTCAIRVDLTLPAGEIAVTREAERNGTCVDVHSAIRDAFEEASRRLQDLLEQEGAHHR